MDADKPEEKLQDRQEEKADAGQATAVETRRAEPPAEVAPAGRTATLERDRFAAPLPHDTERAPRMRALGVALLLLASLSAGFLGGWLGAGRSAETADVSMSSQQRVVTSEGQLISNIAKTVGPSVVSIDVTSRQEAPSSFFGLGGTTQARSAGTDNRDVDPSHLHRRSSARSLTSSSPRPTRRSG